MPIYKYEGKKYNIPEDKVAEFERAFPNATVVMYAGDKTYNIPVSKQQAFKTSFDDASYNPIQAAADVEGVKTTENGSVVVSPEEGNEVNYTFGDMLKDTRDFISPKKKKRRTLADTLNASVPGVVNAEYTEAVNEGIEREVPLTQEEKDQRAAMRHRLQEDGTIDRMKESRKEARRDKLRAFGSMLGSTPQVTSFGVSTNVFDSTDEQLADVGQALDAGTEYRQNKLLQEKLDVALDMARAGENQDGLRGVENFGLGLWDSATRLSTWDFGASDIVNNLTLQQIVEKWENDPSSLTATEKKVLDGIGMATAVQELYSDQVGIGYNVGQSLPESAGFMASMALNPASGLGKSLARNAVRTYGRKAVGKIAARRALGDLAETAIMTATTGAGRVAADALERINGSSTYEIGKNGVIMYGGQKDQETVGNAVIKAIGSNFIENYSEALGEYFDPLLGMSRKVAAGGLRKMHLDKWADALSDVQPSQMTASIRALREKAKFGGILGEVMEEEVGMALNAISGVGDYTFSKKKSDEEGKQWIFDLENQLTTVLSCAIMSGTLNGVEQVSSVAARRGMEKNAKNAEQEALYRFGSKKFDPLREAIDQASPEGMVDVLRDVYMSQEYTVGQKRALAEYAAARLQLQYYNAADAKARRQVNKTQQELLDAQEAGLNAQLPQFYNIARAAQGAEEDLLDYDGDYNLIDIIRSSMNRPEEMERILGDLPPREAQLVTNYIYSKARMEGAYQGRSNRAEDYVDDFAYALEPAVVTDAEGNRTITTALLGDRSVYVLDNNGDLAHIMRPDGSKTLIKASELTNITTSSAEEVIDRYRDMYTSEYNAETENAFEHHPKTQSPQVGLQLQSPEGEVVITAVNDNMVEIVPAVYKDGQVQPKEGAEPKTITVDDAYDWQDSYYQGLDDAAATTASQPTVDNMSAKTTKNESTPTEEIEQSVSEEVTNGQITETQPTETEGVTPVAPAAPQTARERVPKDEKGDPIYEHTDADTAWDAIVEETEGNVEMAQSVAEQMLANKKAALEKLQKGKAKAGANVAQIIANEKKHQEAIANAEADVKAWERIAQVNTVRQQKAELERASAEKAEAEQRRAEEARILAEQEEQARIEREQLNGVPDMVDDVPADARARGFRRVNGHKVDRQGVLPSLQGKEVGVKFANDMIANGRVAVIEAETLQPSHLQGQRNPAHFIDEAQPKERNDEASIASARKIASNIRPEEITTSVTAYTGAPTVNMRGEAIQGNSRSDALRVMWAEHPDQAEKYKQYLIDHAEEFGLNAEEVAAMQHPVLVNMLDVNDADAINLGQYVAQDTESGGTERIKPKNVARKMGSDIRSYANILLRSSDEEASFSELVDKNGVEVLKWMNTKGYITPTQYASAFDSKGNMTAEAKNDLRGILYQSIFQGGNTQLEEQFNAMPAKAQKAILATAYRDYDSPESERMIAEIQSSIRAYYALSHDRAFVDAKNYAEAKEAMLVWSRQYQMDDVTGESFLPSENFSNFALELAVVYKGWAQTNIQSHFNNVYDLVQGTKEASLFEEADNIPRALAEAIKETFNIEYNGQLNSNSLAVDSQDGQAGERGSDGDTASGERAESGEGSSDSGRGADATREQGEVDGKRKVTANAFEMAEEAQKKRKSKKKKNDKLAEKNHQQEENRSETQGVGNRPQLQDASSYESFIERVAEYLQRSYKGTTIPEEVAQIIRDFNKGKTILARTEQEKGLLKMLRVMTNKDIEWLLSELNTKRDSLTNEEERKVYDDAVTLASRYRGRGEHNAVVRALTGANLREKLPLTKIDELFDKYNSDADVAELYRRVRAIAEQIGLDFWFDDNMIDVQAGGFRGADNRVRFNAHMLYSPFVSEQTKASVIVHEILHSVADYAIEAQIDVKLGFTPKVQLSKQVLSAANTILNIYNKVVQDNTLLVHEEYDYKSGEMKVVPDYGTISVHEMLSEISNPEFRDKLKQIEYNGRSVWQRIWDALKSMFTQSSDVTNPTAYDSMAKALDVLINEFSMDAYQKYSGLEESAMKLSAEENLRFREKDEPKDGKSLVGLHNISEEKLKKALKMGGLANPSIAVIDVDKQDHTGYGGITLVAPSSLIDKKTGKNVGTYTADAWTPIYPNVVKQMSNEKAYNESIDSIPSELRSKVRLYFNAYLEDGNIGGAMYYWFLHDTGRNPEMVQSKSEVYSEDELNAFEAISRDYSFYRLSDEDKQKVLDLYVKSIGGQEEFDKKIARRIEHMQKQLLREDLKPMLRQKVERKLQEIQEYGYDYEAVSEYYNAAQRALNARGKLDEFATFRNAEDVVRNEGLQKDFEDWLAEKEEQFGVKEYIFTGYTNSGDRKYVPNTLANASKEMKKSGRAGATGLAGFNHYISTLAQNVGSLNQIRKKKSNLSSEEEYNAFRDKWGEVYIELAQALQPEADGWADYGFYRLEEMSTVKNPKEHVKKEYGIDLSDDFMQKYNSLVAAIKNDFPARYFETKFERPVYLNEFAAAVVPTGTSQEVVDALKKSGLEVVEYEQGNEEARTEAVRNITNEIENIRFRDGAPFFSNAERAVENIKQQKATPEQWLAMIKKDGGLKAGEDKWMGLSDWLNEQKTQGVKTLTKDEVLQFIRENQIEIEEVNYEEGVEDARYDAEEAIRENLQELFDMKVDEVRDENPEQIYMSDIYEEAFERVCAAVGYNKDDAPFVYTNATITLRWYPDVTTDELLTLSRRLGFSYENSLSIPNAEQINSTRLDYTTEGLDNKREIALVVPTIEPWNESDTIHFGDAGEGRAVAWVRFGETTADTDETIAAREAVDDYLSKMRDKYNAAEGEEMDYMTDEEIERLQKLTSKEIDLSEKKVRVLVIDEVQSKRHDEGRAKGYSKHTKREEFRRLVDAMYDKYGANFHVKMTRDEEIEFDRLTNERIREDENNNSAVPDAPFDKNYHELVMKRMLRYAAENGFDKVAWTKGAQQAERYNIGNVVNFIEVENWGSDYEGVEYEEGEVDEPKNTRGVMMDTNDDPISLGVNREGVIVKALHKNELLGKKLSDVVGKDLAASIISKEGRGRVNANEIRIGAEGMNGFYDEMIPRFMNKYTKKWGTKVGEVTLPNVEEAGRTMWSVDVTPEMRESVMQGQPMFREGMGAISDREVSYENDPIAKFQGKPRYYGKKAAAFAERERRRMENAAKEAAEMLGIEAEIVTDASTLQGRKAKAKGWYDIVNKKVVVVVPNHVSMGDAVRTVLHEGVAHHGLRELFGEGFDAMLDNIYNNVAPELKARIDAIAERTGVSTQVATEEYLASLAETTNFEEAQRRGWWQQIKRFFVDMLNKLAMPGLNLKEELTDNELRYLLWRSYKNLVEPNSYLKPLGYAEDVVKQKELKVGEYAEKAPATPMAAEMSEAEESEAEGWAAITMQRIEELEAQMEQLDNEIAEMEADRDADDESRYDMWEEQLDVLNKQRQEIYDELEGLYSLEADEEDIEDYEAEREAEKQRQLYQKRIDNAYLKAVREGDWEEATDLFRQYVLSKAEDEGIVPMDYGVGYRGGAHSSIAKKVKEENPDAIAEAAYQMSIRIPKGSILVPMPSRTGNATYTVKLAEAIAKATDSEVRDVLKGKARMSVYEAKQKGIKMTPEDLGMYTTEELPKGKNIVIIDNVIDKGTTALAAVSAVKGASVVAYAYTLGDKQRVATLKLAEPVTYDDNKRIIPLSQRFNKETDDIRYRLVDDPAEIERLESESTIKAYRAMQVINGELYPPMSAVVDGKLREPIALGQWEQSEERPDLADDNGRFKLDKGNKKSLKAAYNPYFHSSSTPLNDQFSEAQDRDNLVTVEVEVPVSETDGTSGYKAEKAKDAVGTHQWKAGIIQGQLTGTREVFLTRWDKPIRIVPESEVADVIVEMFGGKDIVMPSNVVTPQLRKELEARGIAFVETDNQGKLVEGEHKGEHYSKVYGKKSTNKSKKNAEIIAEVERESAALGVPVRIARSMEELPDEDTRKRAVDGQLKGYFDLRTGEVVLYEPNTDDANDAKRTVLHEIVGHKGLRQLIGEQRYDKAMLQLMYMLPADVRDAVLRRAERHGWNAAIAMDEYLAEQAERDVQPTWWGKVNAKIRAILRNIGFNVKLTDADVTYLLWRSRKKLQGDSLNDMAVNAILKQAARKSAEAEAWNEQAFQDAEMRDFESNALPSIRHRMGADTNDYEKTVRTLGFKQAESWQDSMRSLLVFQAAIAKASGKDISDFENAYMYENRMSSANLMEMEQYRHMVYNPLLKEIHELEQMGASRESIINYLFAKSGLERNEVFARRDAKKHAEGDATKEQQLYDKYRQKDYAGLTALTRGDAQIATLVDDHSKKKTEYDRLEQNKKRGVAVSDADLKAAKKEMNDARKAMITAIEAEAQRMVDEFEAQHNTDNLWDKIRNCTHTTLNISHDAGVMSDEVYGELWNQFQYYIPLRGFAETTAEDVYLYLGGSDSPYNAPIKTAYGRTSLADDPIATIGNMAESAIVEANRNRLKQRFLYMVERHNTDLASISDVWLEYDDVNDEWHTLFAQIPDNATPSEAKRLQQEFEERMKLLAEQNPGKYANASQQPNIPYRVVKKGDRQEHFIIVKRNGKDVVITINGNPRVAQAINGLTNPEQNQGMITRITSWINRNLSANFTMRNPAFMVSNFVRDGFYTNSMVWVKENPAYAWQYNQNWMKCTAQIMGLVSRYKRYEKGDTSALDMNNDMDRMFYEFMINGGETGYTVIKSVEDYKGLVSGEMKKMEAGAMGTARRVADTIGNVVDTFGRWAEDTSRFAAYMTSRQLGRTITKSIWDAKEISVNFNKKGSGNRMMGKFEQGNRWNYVLSNMSQLGRNLYVFWNAGMQGLNNFSKAAKKAPAKFAAMAGTYFALGVLVAAAFSGDDDEDDYYNLPEYVRRNNICFKIGKGKYATLPLPIEIRAIYGLGELAYSYLSGREGLTHGEAVTKTIQQMTQIMPIDMMADGGGAMALVPSAAKPVVEVIHNVDWTGRPIYKEKTPWNQNDPTWTLAFKSTSPELVQMSRLVNEWTNKNTADGLERPYNRGWADNRYLNNPAVWEHIAEGYLGGVATMFNQTKKTLMMPFNEYLREVRNVPIVSRFVKDAGKEGRSYAARNEYYDAKDKMESWKNEISKLKKEMVDPSLTDEQRDAAIRLRGSLEDMYMDAIGPWDALDQQRNEMEEAYRNEPTEELRQELDAVMKEMSDIVEVFRN